MIRICEHFVDERGIPSGGVIIDVGAHHGDFSIPMNERFGVTAHMFEPAPAAMRILRQRIASLPQGVRDTLFVRLAAITGSTAGSLTFHEAEGMPSASSPHRLTDVGAIEVSVQEALPLSSVLSDIPRVDYLKLDCEGSEIGILLGTPAELLRRCRWIGVEFHDTNPHIAGLGQDRAARMRVIGRLTELSFRCRTVDRQWEYLFERIDAKPR